MKYNTFRNLAITGGVLLLGLGVWQCSRCGGDDETDTSRPAATRPAPPDHRAEAREVRAPDAGGSPAERYLLSNLGRPSRGDKIKDALGGGGPKVNVYDESGTWGRAKVDFDRDEKWDEKWTVKPGGVIEKQVAPADDENYTQTLRRVGDAWVDPSSATPPEPAPTTAVPPEPAPTTAVDPEPEPPAAPPERDPLLSGGEIEQAMASARTRPVVAKIKDVTKGRPFKINIYSDDGARWSRAKVDLDRDDKWDEKWTFDDDGSIEKQVAPADDENYESTYLYEDGGWREI